MNDVLSIEAAADALELAPETLRRWVRSGRIRPVATYGRPMEILIDAEIPPPGQLRSGLPAS